MHWKPFKSRFLRDFQTYRIFTCAAQLQVCPSRSKTSPVGHLTAAKVWPPAKSFWTHRTASRQLDSVLNRKYSLGGRFLHSSSITPWSLSSSARSVAPKSIWPRLKVTRRKVKDRDFTSFILNSNRNRLIGHVTIAKQAGWPWKDKKTS